MIFTFRFISDEEEAFILDININQDQTFEQLHTFIQKTLGYDAQQLASFFTSNDQWEKLHEITLMDMGGDGLIKTMHETKIEDFFSNKGQQILYVFDYFNERLFFGSVTRTIDAKPPIELPSVSRFEGKIPPQFSAANTLENMEFDFEDAMDDSFDFEDLPEDLEDFDQNEY